MPKVLVIPDIHLKPWMFERASRAMARADVAVVLGDLVDDWGRQLERPVERRLAAVVAA